MSYLAIVLSTMFAPKWTFQLFNVYIIWRKCMGCGIFIIFKNVSVTHICWQTNKGFMRSPGPCAVIPVALVSPKTYSSFFAGCDSCFNALLIVLFLGWSTLSIVLISCDGRYELGLLTALPNCSHPRVLTSSITLVPSKDSLRTSYHFSELFFSFSWFSSVQAQQFCPYSFPTLSISMLITFTFYSVAIFNLVMAWFY